MDGQLTLVDAAIFGPDRLYAQRPVAQEATELADEPLVAAVRLLADGQQLIVAAPDPRHLIDRPRSRQPRQKRTGGAVG